MFSLQRPTADQVAKALAAAEQEQPAYDGLGGTATGTTPAGYRRDSQRIHLGHGDAVFTAAVAALDSWVAQRSLGITVTPQVRPTEGATVVLCSRQVFVWVLLACRVVYRVEESDRAGFGYGTLSQHPASGEEAFLIERDAAGVVRAHIVAFSRPNHWLTRLGGPVPRLIQKRATRGYLKGIRRAVASAS